MVMVLAGCVLGLPPMETDTPEAPWPAGCIPEDEPNDFEGEVDYQFLGVWSPGEERSICGRLTSSGYDGEFLTGDEDYFVIETLDAVDLTLELDAGVDSFLWLPSPDVVTFDEPLSWSMGADEVLLIGVARTAGGPTDYSLSLRAR